MTITIANNNPRIAYTATASQTAFTVPFEFFDASDLNVFINETLKTITTHYTVSGGNGSTGTVTLTSGATVNDKVLITRDVTLERTTDFPTSGPFQVASLNTELDKIIAMMADLNDLAGRGIQLADSDTAVSVTLPNVTGRAGKVLAFNASTGAVEAGPTITATQTVAEISADISTVAGISSNVTTVAGDATDIGTVAGISSEIASVAGISSNVTSVAAKASLITSDFVSDLNTLATTDVISDLDRLATSDIVSDLNTLATSDIVSDINTLATSDIVSDLNTLATSDFVNDLNLLATSANVTNISTVASNITNVNNFAARYRISSSDPTTSLDEGDLVYTSTDNALKFYDGSAWQSVNVTGIGNIVEDTSPQLGGTLDVNGNTIDMNGNELILDVDADTSITADTDDQIDFKVGGADKASLTSSGFNIGVNVALQTDSSKIAFGVDGDIELIHNHNTGLLLKNTNTADGNPAILTLQTGETAVETGDNLGQITFQAPDEAGGTDAIIDGAKIAAVAEADFEADANATSLRFLTAASGTVTSKMAIRSDGMVGIGTNSPNMSTGIGLEIEDAGTCGLRIQRTGSDISVLEIRADDGHSSIDARGSAPLDFEINGVYKNRMDISGNFRIGTTDSSPSSNNVTGIMLSGSTGSIHASRSNNVALLLNRGNNGFIQQFRRAGTTIAGISITSTAVTYGTGSDYRLKENVTGLTDGITRLKKLDPKRFNFIVEPDTICDGFIAHEVAEVVPEAIAGEKDATEPIGDVKDADGKTLQTGVVKPDEFDKEGHTWTATGTQPVYQNIDQSKLVPLLTAALQEAIAKIETLETKVAALEG